MWAAGYHASRPDALCCVCSGLAIYQVVVELPKKICHPFLFYWLFYEPVLQLFYFVLKFREQQIICCSLL